MPSVKLSGTFEAAPSEEWDDSAFFQQVMETILDLAGPPDPEIDGWFTPDNMQHWAHCKIGEKPARLLVGTVLDYLALEEMLIFPGQEESAPKWFRPVDPTSLHDLMWVARQQSSKPLSPVMEGSLEHFFTLQLAEGVDMRAGRYISAYSGQPRQTTEALVDRGLLEPKNTHNRHGGYHATGRLGEYLCSTATVEAVAPSDRTAFEESAARLLFEADKAVPRKKYGWRDGGVIFLADEMRPVREKIDERWEEFRRRDDKPDPQPVDHDMLTTLVLDYDVEVLDE